MSKFLETGGLTYLAETFKSDIIASDPVYFGQLSIDVTDESDDGITFSLEGTSNSELATVTINVTCNNNADVTFKVEAA